MRVKVEIRFIDDFYYFYYNGFFYGKGYKTLLLQDLRDYHKKETGWKSPEEIN